MSDKNNSTNGLIAFLKQVWVGITGIIGVVSAVLGYIKLAEGNLGLFTLILLAVSVGCLYLSCFYYLFFWQPKKKVSSSSLILPNSKSA